MTLSRIKSGITGLDELVDGGLPEGRIVLVSGGCGTGKSIFALQYLYYGASVCNEPGVFVTFDEMPSKIRQDMLALGWNFKAMEDAGKLAIIDATSARAGTSSDEEHSVLPGQTDIDRLLVEIMTVARNIGAKRIAIDSIPSMAFRLEDHYEVRKSILKLAYVVSRSGLTALITTEVPEQSIGSSQTLRFSKYGVEEYVSDGVILLNFLGLGGASNTRTLYVRKLRGTKHSMEIHPMEITDKGIIVRKIDDVFK
jgi:KaiC/GvpD/RAD55 family RecA-like ATPase